MQQQILDKSAKVWVRKDLFSEPIMLPRNMIDEKGIRWDDFDKNKNEILQLNKNRKNKIDDNLFK